MEEDTIYQKVTLPYTDMAPKGGETPFFLVILLLVFFPPAAWYVMWKEEEYHMWFPWLIGFYGLLTILFSLFTMYYIIPTIQSFSESLQIQQPRTVSHEYLYIFVILGIIEILFAGVLFFHNKKYQKIPKTWLIISVAAVAFNSMIQPAIQGVLTYMVLSDVYKQTRLINPVVVSPSPSPSVTTDSQTANWKTYTNMQINISLKYPDGWEVSVNKNNPLFLNIGPEHDLPKMYGRSFNGDSDEYIKKHYLLANVKTFSQKSLPNTEYSVTEYHVVYDDVSLGFGPGENTLIIVEKSDSQKFLFDSYGSINENFYDIFSTFKFLDQSSNISPTCRPRPECLDTEPRCLMPETSDMCPAPTE